MRIMDWQWTRIGAVGAMASLLAFGRGALRRSGSCRSISGMALACLIVVGADAAATASPMRSGIAPDAPPGAVEIVAADRERAGESGVEVAGAEPSAERAEGVEVDATSGAVLEAVEALEATAFGQWLRTHELAWNAIALGAIAAFAFVAFVALRAAFRGVVRTALARGGRERAAAEVERARIPGVVALMPVLLLASRTIGALGAADLLQPLAAVNLANLMSAATVVVGIVLFGRLLTVADELYSARPEVNRKGALAGYRQVAMVPVGLIGVISAIAVAVGKSPVVFLAALGALAAVVGVVFKDFILSLVANLMLTATDAIRTGDWIELKQHGVDGRIAEIKTTAVRVQNADGTVHSVPIARFVQEPYLNYRSKYGSPGRRVRRSVRVDARSVRDLGADELATLAKDPAMAAAIERARATAVGGGGGESGAGANAKPLTNLACFKAAVECMLAAEGSVDDTLPIAITQGEWGGAAGAPASPSPAGIPIDLLCFLKPAPLAEMTAREGAIVDRILVSLPPWGLRAFQSPTDLPGLAEPLATAAPRA